LVLLNLTIGYKSVTADITISQYPITGCIKTLNLS
jgi:hypothetical protein